MENQNNNGSSAQKSFVERLAENLGGTANAARIYGTPVERDGVTVIPVAKAGYGFGGGAGKKAGEEGTGGGGGMMLTPIGYIEMKGGNTRFRTTRDPQTILRIVAIGSLFTFLTVRSIMKLSKHK
ncbi:hypothetical protein MKJ04_04860 [Pontibacter sp. E15-1]|uniref:spore germination protein GerW family protein n=1 Tax=Pontibacter sp. E15-1 TaxID=2919918 RepID=UPI001F4F6E53|nr:spore germination protein GerW family protein [Pontibacter sp. E15-1]MCJ8164162.1 hypothetical protein [Pontibacter sp. E15-1]